MRNSGNLMQATIALKTRMIGRIGLNSFWNGSMPGYVCPSRRPNVMRCIRVSNTLLRTAADLHNREASTESLRFLFAHEAI
jgi:hypothetical protein